MDSGVLAAIRLLPRHKMDVVSYVGPTGSRNLTIVSPCVPAESQAFRARRPGRADFQRGRLHPETLIKPASCCLKAAPMRLRADGHLLHSS